MAIDMTQRRKAGALPRGAGDTPDAGGAGARAFKASIFPARKLKAADRMFFTEQLSLLLVTGNSLTQALKLLVEQAESKAMRDMLTQIVEEIENGSTFSDGLEQFPDLFSTTYTNLVRVSENGAFMPKVLQELLAMDEKRESLRATIRSAVSYPMFLLCFSMAVVFFVLIVIFPKFSSMFAPIMDELPASTRVLMAFSQSVTEHWIIYLCVLAASVVGLHKWLGSPQGRGQIDKLKLSVPVVRTIFSELYVVQSLRVMGLSLSNGVSIVDTLQSCHEVVNNQTFRRFVMSLEVEVQCFTVVALAVRAAIPDASGCSTASTSTSR